MGVQTRFHVPQALAPRQLGISQTKELIRCEEASDSALAPISAATTIELVPRKKLKELPENSLTGGHGHPPEIEKGITLKALGQLQIEKRTIVSKSKYIQHVTDVHSNLTGQQWCDI